MKDDQIVELIRSDIQEGMKRGLEILFQEQQYLDDTVYWQVDVKGSPEKKSWEISVVRSDNQHGIRSWGWFDRRKILVSSNGGPGRYPIMPYVFYKQVELANEICEALNSAYPNEIKAYYEQYVEMYDKDNGF